MRRGEIVLSALFLIGVIMHIVPARQAPIAASRDHEDVMEPLAAESLLPDAPVAESLLSAFGGAVLDHYSLDPKAATRWKLPARLKEISGLALTTDGRLLAHNDEEGFIYEVDARTGEVTKSFGFVRSSDLASDDFEGIAVAEDRIYLVTGGGHLYELPEGGDGEQVVCDGYDTGLGKEYELEGLAYEPLARDLLLASKRHRGEATGEPLYIFRWSIDTKSVREGGRIEIPAKEIALLIEEEEFNTSGLERHPPSGHYVLVAARQSAIAEITPTGALVRVRRLPSGQHRQAEGITFSADYDLILSDEGGGKRARLTIYPVR